MLTLCALVPTKVGSTIFLIEVHHENQPSPHFSPSTTQVTTLSCNTHGFPIVMHVRMYGFRHTSWSTKMRPIWAWKCYISGTKATACISSCLGGAPFNMAGPISSVSTVKQ
jgi:hypothetical protein